MPTTNDVPKPDGNEVFSAERRAFLGRTALAAGAAAAVPYLSFSPQIAEAAVIPGPATDENLATQRADAAYDVRRDAADYQYAQPLPQHPDNGDEALYHKKIGSFTKALKHNGLGEVNPHAFDQLRAALITGSNDDFESVPLGGSRKLANPQATYAFSLEGADSHALSMPPAPAFASEDAVAEIVEVYWHALLRDVPFEDYSTHPDALAATADMNTFLYFQDKYGGGVSVQNLFRGETAGDLVGPFVSQFLLKPIPFGATWIEQRYTVDKAGVDFMTSYDEWLEVQRGNIPGSSVFDSTPRYIKDARGLGSYVHSDFTYQAYLSAAQIIVGGLGIPNPWDPNLPYTDSTTQGRFVTLGAADLLTLIAKAAHEALKAAWFEKWQVHLRLRPEAFGGRIHNNLVGKTSYDIHGSVDGVSVFERTFERYGSYLLPMAYPEGSPTHPAYPAGHATVAGACVTVLKAFFDTGLEVPNPVVPNAGGTELNTWTGSELLTIGGELNKLAANISLGRDMAGVHWRSDGIEGLFLGEQVAIRILKDIKRIYNEEFDGFTFPGFDDQIIQV